MYKTYASHELLQFTAPWTTIYTMRSMPGIAALWRYLGFAHDARHWVALWATARIATTSAVIVGFGVRMLRATLRNHGNGCQRNESVTAITANNAPIAANATLISIVSCLVIR